MRRVLRKENDRVSVEIETPWLTEAEAAAYCACSRSTFRRRFVGVPCGGTQRSKLYHCAVLDSSIASMVQGSGADETSMPTRRRGIPDLSITDPSDGKVYRPKPDTSMNGGIIGSNISGGRVR